MAVQSFSPFIVVDDQGLPASGATVQVFNLSDTGFTTPLTVTDMNGLPLTLTSNSRGIVPAYRADAATGVVVARSGSLPSQPFVSLDYVITAGQSAAASALAAAEAQVAAQATADTVATFQKWIELGITQRNEIPNPSFETNTTGWTATQGASTVTRTDFYPQMGGRQGSYVSQTTTTVAHRYSTMSGPTLPLVPGRWYGVAAWVACDSATSRTIALTSILTATSGVTYPNSSAASSTAIFYAGRTMQRVFQAPADALTIQPRVQLDSGSDATLMPVGTRIWSDQWRLVQGQSQAEVEAALSAPYFDGDTPSTQYMANRWSGTPHASVSEQLDMTPITDQQLPAGGTMGQALVKLSNNDRDVAWGTVAGGGGGTSVHGLLSGLDQDDHPQYLNNTRGDARYYTKSQVDTAVNNAASAQSSNDRNRANHTGTQPIASIAGLPAILDGLGGTAVNSVATKTGHVVLVSSDISDTGATGREIMGATTAAAVRTAAGAAATSHTHTPAQTGATATGQGLMTATDAAAGRAVIGAGTSSLELGTTASTAMRGNAIVLNPSTLTGLPVGTFVART